MLMLCFSEGCFTVDRKGLNNNEKVLKKFQTFSQARWFELLAACAQCAEDAATVKGADRWGMVWRDGLRRLTLGGLENFVREGPLRIGQTCGRCNLVDC